jgi:ceramide glucosyltransferase
MTAAVAHLGLKTVLADRVTEQPLGRRSWSEVWNRQLRWRLIWRFQAPAVFAGSLLTSAMPAAIAAALAAPLLGFAPAILAGLTLAAWLGAEVALSLARGWPVSFWSPLAFLGREILEMLVWLRALTTSEVKWAGVVYRLGKPSAETATPASLSPAFQRDVGAGND